jgi:hypothetical protein
MQTILALIKKAGGWHPGLYLKIDNPPYMELVIEAVAESGPMGLPALSVAHYGEQNGDLMRDPEMCFELCGPIGGGVQLDPFYWRNDYIAIEQWSRNILCDHYICLGNDESAYLQLSKTDENGGCRYQSHFCEE